MFDNVVNQVKDFYKQYDIIFFDVSEKFNCIDNSSGIDTNGNLKNIYDILHEFWNRFNNITNNDFISSANNKDDSSYKSLNKEISKLPKNPDSKEVLKVCQDVQKYLSNYSSSDNLPLLNINSKEIIDKLFEIVKKVIMISPV